jgi:hypothetical protein
MKAGREMKSRIETLFTKLRHQCETNWCDSWSIGRANHFPANKTVERHVNSTDKRSAARCGRALVEDETMTFALGLFATLISAMFIATFASSVIVSSREAQADDQNRRYRVF